MAIVLDTCILIAAEKGQFPLSKFLAAHSSEEACMSTITASELLHGVERVNSPERKRARAEHVEAFLNRLQMLDFDLAVARRHAALWAFLEKSGTRIGPHDLLIAATALTHDCALATLNTAEFKRVPDLRLIDITPFAA